MGAFETDDDVEVDRTLANALSDCMDGLVSEQKNLLFNLYAVPVSNRKFHIVCCIAEITT